MQAQVFRVPGEVHNTQRCDAILWATSGQTKAVARIGAPGAPSVSADVVATFDENPWGVTVEHDVVATHMGAERGSAD